MNTAIIKLLEENTTQLLEYVTAHDEEIIQIIPPSGKWSIIQNCDHLMSVDFGVFSLMSMDGIEAPKYRESKLEIIKAAGTDRSSKVTAPPQLAPKGKTDTLEKFTTKFPSLRNKMISTITTKDLTLVCDKFSHFVFGELTFGEWIHFSIQHTNRHKLQMQEVLDELKVS